MDLVLNKETGTTYLEIKNKHGEIVGIAKYDSKHENLIKQHKWYKSKYGYVVTSRGLRMHRLIMNAPEGFVVDHINHDKMNNCEYNLRICTNAENTRNRKAQGGIRYRKDKRKYEAYLSRDYKHIFLGYYDSYEEALAVRKNAEQRSWSSG